MTVTPEYEQAEHAPGPPPALPAPVQWYVAAWIVISIGAALAAYAVARGGEPSDPAVVAGVMAAVAIAELTELRFRFSSALTSAFTLVEAAIIADILLLDPANALLAAGGGAVVANLIRRRELTKVGFNASQIVVSAGAAALVVQAFPDVGPIVAGEPILGAVAGMVVYGLINFVALAGLLRLLADRGVMETLRDQGWLMLATLVGDAPLGLLAAELTNTNRQLLVLLIGPAAAVYFAYRGTVRTNALLAQARIDNERLERVTGGTSDGILLLDREGRIEVWNDSMDRLTGIPAGDALGHPVGAVLARCRASDEPAPDQLLAAAHPSDPARTVEATLTHVLDLERRHVRESHTFLFDERGRCTGDVVLFADVTRERELEALKGDFVARVSHELRTPLTPIKGFADILLKRGSRMTEDQRRSAVERIVERTDAMAGLVEDLLLVTQIDEGAAKLVHPVRCWIQELLDNVVERLRAEHAGREIHVSVADGIGAALADPDRTRQVLGALIDNALRYSEPDTHVDIEVEEVGDDVVVHIRDHGPGIPSSQHEVIFERFHRLEDVLRMRTGGVGLGLFLARRLAEAMHGRVTVRSAPGEGSTFSLWLPAAVPTDGPEPARQDTPGIVRLSRFPGDRSRSA